MLVVLAIAIYMYVFYIIYIYTYFVDRYSTIILKNKSLINLGCIEVVAVVAEQCIQYTKAV